MDKRFGYRPIFFTFFLLFSDSTNYDKRTMLGRRVSNFLLEFCGSVCLGGNLSMNAISCPVFPYFSFYPISLSPFILFPYLLSLFHVMIIDP